MCISCEIAEKVTDIVPIPGVVKIKDKACYSSLQLASLLRELPYHMGPHDVTCHPVTVNLYHIQLKLSDLVTPKEI